MSEHDRLVQVLDSLGLGFWRRDLTTGEMYWSDTFRRIHGIPHDAPATREVFLSYLHPEDRARIPAAFDRAYAEGHGLISYRVRRFDDQVLHFRARIVVFSEADGQRIAFGINERLENALASALQWQDMILHAVVTALPVGLMVFAAALVE